MKSRVDELFMRQVFAMGVFFLDLGVIPTCFLQSGESKTCQHKKQGLIVYIDSWISE